MTLLKNTFSQYLVALLFTLLLCGLIWGIHHNSPRTLISFHGFLHAAIVEQFIGPQPAKFPPENPFYAGEPLCYYWAYQYFAAQFVRIFGINVFYGMEWLAFVAVALLVFSALPLGKRLFRSAPAGFFISILVVVGANLLGIVYLALRAFRYGKQMFLDNNPSYLWGVIARLSTTS
jgi:hypothetical protein